jgi:hypothetical protein
MDSWRHLPSYQLERRADIFFAAYLPDIIRHKLDLDPQIVIPEFPVRIGTVNPNSNSNRSYKVDYVVTSGNSEEVLFIELKTDMQSRRGIQDRYLKKSKQLGMKELLEGVRLIYQATNQKSKYKALIKELEKSSLIKRSNSETFEITNDDYEITIVYIQPKPASSRTETVISFEEIAEILEKKQDELSQRFAKSLRNWAMIEPGKFAITD